MDAVFVKLACAGVRHRDRPIKAAVAVLYQIGLGPALHAPVSVMRLVLGAKGTENDSVFALCERQTNGRRRKFLL